MAYLDTKEHKCWSKAVRQRDKVCVICQVDHHLSAHHLIPKEKEEYRSNINNGITLCFKHHTKWGSQLSPHSHGSLLFYLWLQRNRPNILKWVEEHYEI